MDSEKENDAEENKEDKDKEEMDVDEVNNVENTSNPAVESEDYSEITENTEEGNVLDADLNEDVEFEEAPVSQHIRETLTPDEENKENKVEKNSKSEDEIKPTDSFPKPKPKGNQKEDSVNGKKKIREGKPFSKVVIRRLPPGMTKEVFMDQVSPLPSYDYFYFVPTNMSSPGNFSRAYINFTNQDDLFDFTRTFDNYVFIDSKGHEYPAIVEFAPYQRVPKARPGRKKDTLMGTLESDPIYLTFKEQLLAEALENSRTTNKQHYFETELNESEEVVTTPLLDYLKARRAEKDRIREERREDRKRKEAERKLLKQKIKDKPDQEEEIEIKISEELIHFCKSDESSTSEDEEEIEPVEEKPCSEEPVIKAILIKPRVKVDNDGKENEISLRKISEGSETYNKGNIPTEKVVEVTVGHRINDTTVIPEDKTKFKVYFRGKSLLDGWQHREPGDMYKFSKYRCWERHLKFGSGTEFRHRNVNRIDSKKGDHESFSDWFSPHIIREPSDISVLQPPKEKKEFFKEKDAKRIKHKDKEDRFSKAENRSREFKNKGGKSYREERLKQAEKREEKKKKENEESKETKDEAAIDEEIKENEKYWSDKKKWKYGGGGDTKAGARTFSRRRDEKKKEIFDRKRGGGKAYRTRKGDNDIDDNHKKEHTGNNTSEKTEKILAITPSEKSELKESLSSPKMEKDSDSSHQEDSQKRDTASDAAQKPMKDKHDQKKDGKKENTPSSVNSRKERLQKESSVDSEEGARSNKDPRVERRIRNKDRPSIEIYRPGMGKFSRQRLEKERPVGSTDESPSHSPSPTPTNNKINLN